MTLTLAVETSSITYGVALLAGDDVLAHRTLRRDHPAFAGIAALAASVVREACRRFAEIERLAVDVGPGNLGSVRTGVAYVNALGFSLRRPIVGLDSLSLLAAQAACPDDELVLCLRNGGSGNVYAGVFRGRQAMVLRYGRMGVVVPKIAGSESLIRVAGPFRGKVPELLPAAQVKDTGVEFPSVLAVPRFLVDETCPSAAAPFVTPLTEASSVFHE